MKVILSEQVKNEIEELFSTQSPIEWADDLNKIGTMMNNEYGMEEIKSLLILQRFFLAVTKSQSN